MALHIGYETVEPWPLERVDAPDEKSRKAGLAPKALLRANKEGGNIQLETETQLTGIPPEAWTYKLGNRSVTYGIAIFVSDLITFAETAEPTWLFTSAQS